MVYKISRELSDWLKEVKEQERFRGHLADLFQDFGKGKDKPLDRELNAVSEALGVSKFMAVAILLVKGYVISEEGQKKEHFFEVSKGDEKLYYVPGKGWVLMSKAIGDIVGYRSKMTETELEELKEHDRQFAKPL